MTTWQMANLKWQKVFLTFAIFLLPCRLSSLDFNDLDIEKAVSGGSKLAKAVNGLSDEDEIGVGREVAANLAARFGLVEDPAKLRYINLVGQAVVRHCDRKRIPYHFGILHTSEINALAAPGGFIFITQGLLESLKDESELAGVLAHEVTHVTRQHVVKAIRQANLLEATEDLSAATGRDVNKYSQISDFSINLLSKGLSRDDELQADKEGTLLAAKVGYDATGLRRSIDNLIAKPQSDLFLARFNKTHPPAKDRLKAIDKVLASHPNAPSNVRLAERFAKYR